MRVALIIVSIGSLMALPLSLFVTLIIVGFMAEAPGHDAFLNVRGTAALLWPLTFLPAAIAPWWLTKRQAWKGFWPAVVPILYPVFWAFVIWPIAYRFLY
jgi:hypothetical protein